MSTGEVKQNQEIPDLRQGAARVPAVTIAFWVAKALTTGMGESSSDYLVHRLPPVLAVALGGVTLVAALVLQFAARRYVPWIYWLSVAMVGVFGTMSADVLHVGLGVPYVVSSAFFAVSLAVVFALWYATERTLSIHSVYTGRSEAFYWAAVMATFALGTAAGDMTAITLHLGYLSSGLMFVVVVAVPALAHRWFSLNAILAFWLAYIATRPLGASFADWMGVSKARGGLNLGAGPVSLALAALIAGCVAYLTVNATRKDVSRTGTTARRPSKSQSSSRAALEIRVRRSGSKPLDRAHGRGLGAQQRGRRGEVDSVRVVKGSRASAGDVGVTTLPDDGIGA